MDDVVRAKALEIVDGQGRMVMRLSSIADFPHIALYDPRDGCERVTISLRDDAQGIAFTDESGKVQLGLGVSNAMGAGINIFDDASTLGILINVNRKSDRNVVVFDQHGQVIGQVGRTA
jgi:hypothetical protein